MRSKRQRTTTRRNDDFVDPDSDEFEHLLGGERPHRKQNSKHPSDSELPCKEASGAAAAEDAVNVKNESAEGGDAAEPDALATHNNSDVGPTNSDAVSMEDTPSCSGSSGSEASSESPALNDGDDDNEDDDEDEAQTAAKGGGKGPKQKKPRKKRLCTRRLCATYAKAQYRLTDNDLRQLTDIEYRTNPHTSRYPMKLYLVRELEALAAAKQAQRAYEAAHKEERAEERALQARARKAAAAAAAAEAAKDFGVASEGPQGQQHGSVKLPDTVLLRMMGCLVNSMEPGGLRGPSAVARDMAAAALVCWDFYHAAKGGFRLLADATSGLQQALPGNPFPTRSELKAQKQVMSLHGLPGPPALGGWPFWDQVLARPTDLKLDQLKAGARQLGLQVTGTKAELMLRLLGAFNLSAPTPAPAQLLRALVLERSTLVVCWDGPDAACGRGRLTEALRLMSCYGHEAQQALHMGLSTKGVAGFRAAATAAGFKSFQQFVEAGVAARVAEQARILQLAQQAAAARAAGAARRGGGMQARPGQCACGNTAAPTCSRGCCAPCCRQQSVADQQRFCHRHRC